jgi:uncharacterized protein YndB with AHSA1/START domain
MAAPRHVLETYIKARPERIWEAITDPAFTARYFFGTHLNTTLEVGSTFTYDAADGSPQIRGEVIEAVAPQRLVLSFSILWDEAAAIETPSRVTWEITPVGTDPVVCRLSCIHGDLALSPRTWELTVSGWPIILAGLKSLVETGEGLGEVHDDGASVLEVRGPVDIAWHRSLAIEANNGTYPLLDERLASSGTDADLDDRLIHRAHAAAHHWRIAGTREQHALAEYLCSRAYAFVGRAEPALHHADRCAAIIAELGLQDWQLAYSLEAQARAFACAGRTDEAAAVLARAVAVPVADPDDAAVLYPDIASEPWYGVTVPQLPGA